MRFWFSHSTEVPLRDQLVRQVSLGILSGELAAGERLPSVRALAIRFHLHRNTVNAAYRQLEEENWVVIRQGSGVYVSAGARTPPQSPASTTLDTLLDQLAHYARQANLSTPDLLARCEAALSRPARMVLVEAESELARIVLFEIATAGRIPPELCALPPERFAAELRASLADRTAIVLPSKAAPARQALGPQAGLIVLEISPIAGSLAAHLPPSRAHLIGVASHWPLFIELVRTMLISAGFDDDALLLRNAGRPDWTAGLSQAATVICDSLTRAELPPGTRPIVFPLLTPAALRHFCLTLP